MNLYLFCRSVNVRSRLDKSVVEDIDSLSETNSLYTSQNSPSSLQERGDSLLQSPSSPSLSMVGSLVSARPGQDMEGYLGMFTKQGKGRIHLHTSKSLVSPFVLHRVVGTYA